MNDDNPQLYDLSRRKLLGGLGAIGLASVGAGLGTSAYFSDTEAFENNTLVAGTLDMNVAANVVAANDYWAENGALDLSTVADSEDAVIGLQVDDVKPGDWAIICFEINVGDNPGYVQVCTENFAETGGANPEPEQDAEGDAGNSADLGEYLLATVWQQYAGPTDGSPGGMKTDLDVLDPVFNNATDDLNIGYQEPFNLDGAVDTDTDGDFDGDDRAHYTNAREANQVLAAANGGYVIKDDNGVPMVVGSDSAGESEDVPDTYEFCLLLELPYAVGNEVQGDTLSFDLVFKTEQVRNNDSPFNHNSSDTNGNGTSPN
jgi:predicted ribosomally synthesized peptide with SipW-like signal peptide